MMESSRWKDVVLEHYGKVLTLLKLSWQFSSWNWSLIFSLGSVLIVIVSASIWGDIPNAKLIQLISEDINDVRLLVFKRNADGLLHPEPLFLDHRGTVNPHLDKSKMTKILIHGWKTALEYAERFIHDYLEAGDYNVITVDWSLLATWDSYTTAAQNSIMIGDHVGAVMAELLDQPDQIHVIGHSLGAHAAGHLGRRYEAVRGHKVSRITGLDPAKPWFDEELEERRSLNKYDADFVDIIHSNGGHLWEGCFSWMEPLGHVDFYPNGGAHQPGCTEICHVWGCTEFDYLDLAGCSHDRSIEYFIESINGEHPFYAQRCDNWQAFLDGLCADQPVEIMGEPLDDSPYEGKYFLNVNNAQPFAYDLKYGVS